MIVVTLSDIVGLSLLALLILGAAGFAAWLFWIEPVWRRFRKWWRR